MRIGLYTFISLTLIGLMAIATYVINSENYMYQIAGFDLDFPIALWISIPMLVLLAMTILYMLYYGTKNYFIRRKWIRDTNELQNAFYWSLLKEPKEHHFSIPEIRSSASILSTSTIDTIGSIDGLSCKLVKTINWIKKINNGEYVDLKEKKIEKFLSQTNPIFIQNIINRIKSDEKFTESVLLSADSYTQEIIVAALDIFVAKQTLSKINKFANILKSSHLETILNRADKGEEIELTASNILYLSTKMRMRCKDYLRITMSTINKLTPDENLEMFKKFSQENKSAQSAYLYLLFQYEMLNEAKEYLEECEEDQFKPFRALLILKQEKYNYRVSDLISSINVCNGN